MRRRTASARPNLAAAAALALGMSVSATSATNAPINVREDVSPPGLAGTEAVCDGVDNDGDGNVDELCENACETAAPGSVAQISNDTTASTSAHLSSSSHGFGVAWLEDSTASRSCFRALDFRAQPVGVRQCSGTITSFPTVASDGDQYAMAYGNTAAPGPLKVWLRRFNRFGNVLSTRQVTSSSSSLQLGLALATAPGEGFFLVWGDNRNGPNDIRYVRIDGEGFVQGSEVLLVQSPGGQAIQPSVVADGTGFAMAWSDNRHGTDREIYFARYDADGTRIGSEIRVTNAAGSSSTPQLYRQGDLFVVIWADNRDEGGFNFNARFRRLDSQGNLVGTEELLTSGANSSLTGLTMLPEADGFTLVWSDSRSSEPRVYTRPFRAWGVPRGPVVELTDEFTSGLSAVASPDGPVFAFSQADGTATNDFEVYVQRVECCNDRDGDGSSDCANDPNDLLSEDYYLAPERCDGRDNDGDAAIDEGCPQTCGTRQLEAPRTISAVNAGAVDTQLVWTGDGYWMYWNTTGPAYLQRLDATGNPVGAPTVIDDVVQGWLGWNGVEAVVSVDGPSTETRFVRVDIPGEAGDVTDVGGAGRPVWNGAEWALVSREAGNALFLVRVDAFGQPLGAPVDLGTTASQADIAWNGSRWGLVRSGSILFQVVDDDGSRPGLSTTLGTGNSVSIVWGGGAFGVTWARGDGSIAFARVGADGTPIGPEVTVTSGATFAELPRITWTGSEYAILWQDQRNAGLELRLSRLDVDGVLLTQQTLTNDILEDSEQASIVWTGADYAVSYQHERFSAPNVEIGDSEAWFARLRCCGMDADGDAANICNDCDDSDPNVFPGACDGLTDACSSASSDLMGTQEWDDDGDGLSECDGDCDDADDETYPGAALRCDGVDNTCQAGWPAVPADETDADLDGVRICDGDCDDTDPSRYPGGPIACSERWSRIFEFGAGADLRGLAQLPGGDAIVVGKLFGEAWAARIDTQGLVQWTYRLLPIEQESEPILNDVMIADGNIAVLGQRDGAMWLALLDPSGAPILERHYENVWSGQRLTRLPGGDFVLAGSTGGKTTLLRVDANGAVQWDLELPEGDDVVAIETTPTGVAVLALGPANGGYLTRVDVNGQVEWSKVLSRTEASFALDMVGIGDDFLVSGTYQGANGDQDGWLARIDENGTIVWQQALDIPDGWVYAAGMASRANGHVLLNGLVATDVAFWSWLAEIDGSGQLAWSRQAGNIGATQIGGFPVLESADGGILVAGSRRRVAADPASRDLVSWVAHLNADGRLGLDCDGVGDRAVATSGFDLQTIDATGVAQSIGYTAQPISTSRVPNPVIAESVCALSCGDGDGDGIDLCAGDCNDADGQIYPGATQRCDGIANDCGDPFWPAVPADEIDDDGDCFVECDPWVGTVIGICGGGGRGLAGGMLGGGDCDDTQPVVYPDAPEINDALDNQCPGDLGYGATDEIGSDGTFDENGVTLTWSPQPGAVGYLGLRANDPTFPVCFLFFLDEPTIIDATIPARGETFYYLSRATQPNLGSWGVNGTGTERSPLCAP